MKVNRIGGIHDIHHVETRYGLLDDRELGQDQRKRIPFMDLWILGLL